MAPRPGGCSVCWISISISELWITHWTVHTWQFTSSDLRPSPTDVQKNCGRAEKTGWNPAEWTELGVKQMVRGLRLVQTPLILKSIQATSTFESMTCCWIVNWKSFFFFPHVQHRQPSGQLSTLPICWQKWYEPNNLGNYRSKRAER